MNTRHSNSKLRVCSFVMLTLLLLGCNPETPRIDEVVPKNESLRFSSQPISDKELFRLSNQPLHENERSTKEFQRQLSKLALYAESVCIGDGDVDISDMFSDQFETTILERDQLQSAYLGERIRIARWRVTDKTPTFYEKIAVRRLIETVLKPWQQKADEFRIEFNIHTVRNRPNYFDAEVLVNISGLIDSGSENKRVGRSAVGLWQFIWAKGQSEKDVPLIKKINMLGHEETIAYLAGGKLFQDCTASALRDDQPLIDNLSHGLDQWVQKIPGIDPLGHNGLSIGDVNKDGLDDVYVCQPHGLRNLLLIQNPDGTVDEKAADYGVDVHDNTVCALLVDLDNNRLQDLILVTDSRLVLYSNSGNETYQLEHSLRLGIGTESITAVDYDNDGDLDLYLGKYRPVSKFDDFLAQPNSKMNAINGGRNILLRNDEAWNFTDVTSETGLSYSNQNYTRCASWIDFDSDGDLDLYLANEFSPDILFRNDNGWFGEIEKDLFTGRASNSTTSSAGDFDRDGKLDVFVGVDSSFTCRRITKDYIDAGGKHLREAKGYGSENRLFHHSGISMESWDFRAPIFSSESTFSSVVADFNNDGWLDLATTNGMLTRGPTKKAEFLYYRNLFNPQKDLEVTNKNVFELNHEISDLVRRGESFNGYQRNRLILGLGAFRFANLSSASGIDFLDDARGIGVTDWDGDGDVDLILTNRNGPRLRILKNVYNSRNQFLKIRLAGTSSNRDAIGTRVEVFMRGADKPLVKTLVAGSGRLSQSSKVLHFGLGRGTAIEKIEVYWPGGNSQTFKEIKTNTTYRIVEGKDEPAEIGNNRYRIALDNKSLQPSNVEPSVDRIRFFPTTRLPILQYRSSGDSAKQRWYQVENSNKRPLLTVFCPYDSDATGLLRDWNLRERNFSLMKADMLVVFTGYDKDRDYKVNDIARQIEEVGFKFRWGVMSQSSNSKLGMAFGQWFFNQKIPDGSFGVLLDGNGNVHFAYDESQLTWEGVSGDLQNLAEKNFVFNQVMKRDKENWVESRRISRFDRLSRRFLETGYERDADRLEEYLSKQHSSDYMHRSIDLAASGQLLAALPAAEKSIDLDPKSVASQINLADIYRQFSETADQQARTRMLTTAGELLDAAIEKEPNNEDAILARAEIFRLQQDIENAITLLKRYLAIHPESWKVHAIVGRLFFHKRQYFEASKYLITAIENRPTLPYVAADLGYLYLVNKQFEDAAEYLNLAVRLQPSEPNLKRYLAEAEFWSGNFDRAGPLFEQTVASQPTLKHPKQMLAWLKGCSPFADFRDGEKGLELISPYIEINQEKTPSVLETYAISLAEVGDFDRALAVQRQAVEVIDSNSSLERYDEAQLKALQDRLELYKRGRKYRIGDPAEVPMALFGEN